MNHIIINGVNSSTVHGLLIQTLPPISKPLMRTEIEEIDGRDGDIVTRLGYAAYDKPFSVGLHGSYDVDEVIRFFAASGKVIFSNEPNKYYLFETLEQIDFEKLIRFRTATVTFHVQPFKYSTEAAVDRSITTQTSIQVTNSGNVISRPAVTLYGSGTLTLSINGVQVVSVALADQGYITLDGAALEAYKGTTLKNRIVTGDLSKLVLGVGSNTLSWTGTVTRIVVENYSRWI